MAQPSRPSVPVGVSRKRSLTFIGLTVLTMSYPSESTPLRQHRVPAATREVPYAHSISGSARKLTPFWIPSDSAHNDRETESRSSDTRRLVRDLDPRKLLADATLDHPDDIFRRLRRDTLASSDPTVRRFHIRSSSLRHATETDESRELANAKRLFVNADVDGEAALNETEFNVTTVTTYNVSASSDVENRTNDTSTVIVTESERTYNATNVIEESVNPIRIRAFLSEMEGGEHLTAEEHEILLQNIVKPALLAWSAALRVDSVRGNLTVDKNQLIDRVSCGPGLETGLPSVIVPSEHLIYGVPDTDMIIYLNIGFVGGYRMMYQNSSEWNSTMMANLSAYDDILENVTAHTGAHQFIANVSTDEYLQPITSRPECSGEYLAASTFCSTDQYDRPTAAILHVCIGSDFFLRRNIRSNIMTIMHEIGHALGFNSVSLAHFRRADGSPITPRVDGVVPETLVECTGPQEFGMIHANISLPSEEILQFRTVRGGVLVAEVVTPSVRQVIRNHFDCQELPGAELESGEFLPLYTNASSCIGDHWERRLLKMDLMNPIVEDLEFNPRLSTITLAYFADSGWYQVDLSRASHAAGWGRGAGCNFTDSTCINPDGEVPVGNEAFFCNDNPSLDTDGYATNMHGCTSDFTKKAACSIGQYSGALPFEYQYFNFTYGADVGGSDPYMDYCPVFAGFTNGLCSDADNEALIRVDQMERFGDRNSRCISGMKQSRSTALCLRIACVVEDTSFRIQVDGKWHPCPKSGAVITSKSGDRVVCPDPVRICPTFFCVRDCLGTQRVCDYDLGECVCNGTLESDLDCDGVIDPFHHPKNETKLPDRDSPLSDYYVPTARMLKDESRRFVLDDWEIVVVTFAIVIIVAVASLIWWRWGRAYSSSEESPHDMGPESVNPNKHKMMATVVVDLRMTESNLRSLDTLGNRASETDQSMTETECGASHTNDLSIDTNDDEEDGEGNMFEPIDPSDPLPCPSTVRRRGKHLPTA